MAELFAIRRDVSPRLRLVLAFVSWGAVVGIWFALTHWKLLPAFTLPPPEGVVQAMGRLWSEYNLLGNVLMSWWRIAQAFLWCVVIAVPLGLLMASFPWVHELINPIAAPMRSMPITAFVPAFIALLGMEETMKVGFLWFGMFFYLLAVVVEEVNKVDNSLLETAYTLGAKRYQVLWLMFRASFPAIFGSFRILYDIGWTYVILAEMVNSRRGVGYMVEAARKVLDFERVYAGIIAIGVAAFLFRFLLTVLEKQLFPWRQAGQRITETPTAPGAARHSGEDTATTRIRIVIPSEARNLALETEAVRGSSPPLAPRNDRHVDVMEEKIKIILKDVSRTFVTARGERVEALRDVNLEVEDAFTSDGRDVGEFRVLLGPSGCGKSTILRMVAGLDRPDKGQVIVNGKPVTGPGRDRGMVFQKYTSFPWLSVEGNIAYGMKINGVPAGEQSKTIKHLLEATGLTSFAKAYPDTLSGGMQQRLAIARTLAVRPQIILMDEPFGALDAQTRSEMQELLLRIWTETACTVLFVTHDVEEAVYLADRIFILSAHPGTIVEDVPVLFGRPRDPSLKQEKRFRELQDDVLASLRRAPGRGQVRVSI